jgi:membrane-bound lytic murein transglycosylase MltF
MPKHSHTFVETYQELVGFGLNRVTDENTVIYYLQKFSDDALMAAMRERFSNDDLKALFELMSELLRKHLDEAEYHRLFLKEDHAG